MLKLFLVLVIGIQLVSNMKKILLALAALIFSAAFSYSQPGPQSLCYTTNGTNCVPVSTSNPLPVGSSTSSSSYTDRSGAIVANGVAQTAMSANSSRKGFLIQNNTGYDLWFSVVGTATAASPSIKLISGGYFETPSSASPTGAVSVFSASGVGQSYTAWEW